MCSCSGSPPLHPALALWGGVHASQTQVGSALGTFVTSGDVADAKAKLAPNFNQTQADAFNCASMAGQPETFNAWEDFYNAWVTFADEDEDTFGHFWTAGSRMDRVESYANQLLLWQERLGGMGCKLSAPLVVVGTPSPISEWMNKAIVLGGVVVAGIVAYELLPLLSAPSHRSRA